MLFRHCLSRTRRVNGVSLFKRPIFTGSDREEPFLFFSFFFFFFSFTGGYRIFGRRLNALLFASLWLMLLFSSCNGVPDGTWEIRGSNVREIQSRWTTPVLSVMDREFLELKICDCSFCVFVRHLCFSERCKWTWGWKGTKLLQTCNFKY